MYCAHQSRKISRLSTLFWAAALFALAPVARAPAAGLDSSATQATPQILNLALPYGLVPLETKAGKTRIAFSQKDFERRLRDLYCSGASCQTARPLQINIALGNDYQILDWLGKGWVDSAVIPPLSLYLLKRDHLDFLEIDKAVGWRQALAPPLRPAGPVPADLTAFREEIWRAAQKGKKPGNEVKNDCNLMMSSHLSTASFLAPIAATNAWLQQKLESESGARHETENRFWSELFDHLRLTFDFPSP